MQYDQFVERVAEKAGIDREEAERASVVVLQELCDRLTGDEAYDLLAQLPAKLKTAVVITQAVIPLTADEFVERVARDLQLEPEEARKRVKAVVSTLREAVSWGEFQDVLEQLDPEYADFLA